VGEVPSSGLVQGSDRGEKIASNLFEQRSTRAALLAQQSEAAREPLQFAAELSKAQASCAERLSSAALSGHLEKDADKILTLITPILTVIASRSDEAKQRLGEEASVAKTRLQVYWSENHADYIARALLQPYAASLREKKIAPDRVHTRGHCPFCGAAAWISARKAGPDSESGFRYLGCSLCGLEWNFNRIACPACGEEDPHKLPNFSSDAHPAVRIETCETCRRYIKSIDMTQDARPIAPIDDLLSLSMDLWAIDEGYVRIEPGMAGM
jgi:formate dehydrogenase maturation protein FdhE